MSEERKGLKRDIGFITALALVVGQMIGTGIFMIPQGMATLSNPKMAVLSVVITGIGSIFLAICFAELGEKMPQSGSAMIYSKKAFGDFVGFLVGWAYWSGCWLADGAIILGGVSYLSYFIEDINAQGGLRFIISVSIVWFYTFLNIRGVKEAGVFNLMITIVKLVPLLVFICIAIPHFNPDLLQSVSSEEVAGISGLPAGIAYMLWAFMGFEGITMNGGEIKKPGVIRKATIIGTVAVIVIYSLVIVLADGNLSQQQLAASASPMADIIANATGWYWAGGFIALGIFVCAAGCLGAWILSSSRILYAMSETKLFPRAFSKVGKKRQTPYVALYTNAILITIVLMLNLVVGLTTLYNFLILLAVSTFLVFYGFGAASHIMLMAKKEEPFGFYRFVKHSLVGLIALAYAIYTIYGAGAEAGMYCLILLMVAIPFYIYFKFQNNEEVNIRKNM